ncbi:MAG: type I DNA topoisomerase [Alphaproteobacteria bacterium]|nr:type I DNA topoisomerase [Alphaproteobacteria bacterium]
MNVVVVESPAKAKTIEKYLGADWRVLASYGHVRDLPPKDGSVRPDADFAMDWQVEERAERQIREIAKALKGADTLWLATDPDREGEAISWHIAQILDERGLLKGKDVHRVVFNEITQRAVREAFKHPRAVNRELVDAYLARRALDYLVGFTLSPVLWRKLPGSRSAGRVQSVALRLVCEREAEIERFRPREYWSIVATLANAAGEPFTARLTHIDGKRLDRFDLANAEAAERAKAAVEARALAVAKIERRRTKRSPQPPFTTSTLQQEASRKLGFGATRTMRTAQRLYEGVTIGGETVGLITYMRTDSVQLSNEAIAGARTLIDDAFGGDYLPANPRVWRTRAKNAQEAHEAIRPTDIARRPEHVSRALGEDERRLYELIWQRTIASEMADAELDRVGVDIAAADGGVGLRATGQTVAFDGFLRLYREDRDDPIGGDSAADTAADEDDEERRLPLLAENEALARRGVAAYQHFTQPPPRYSEASLVKKLEELGIGRPSTYASILQVLQDRGYVVLDKRRFVPEDQGRLVTSFLTSFFRRYVEYDFTALLEEQLDDVSGGRIYWKAVLREFWTAFAAAVEDTRDLNVRSVLDALDEDLGPHFFPPNADGTDPRRCQACANGRLGLKLGRHGPFVGCSNYPECNFTRALVVPTTDANGDRAVEAPAGPRQLGTDPATGKTVSLRNGPYGPYVQLDESGNGKDAPKPKRSSLPKGMAPDEVDLATALALLELPREIGPHPEDGQMMLAGLGRFGAYVKHGGTYANLPEQREVLTVGANRAVALLAEKAAGGGRSGAPQALRDLGAHPGDGQPVRLMKGRYGPYVAHGKVYASLPRDGDPDALTMPEAVQLLAARAAKGPAKRTGRGGARGGARPKAKAPAKAASTAKAKVPAKAKAASAAKAKKPAAKRASKKK